MYACKYIYIYTCIHTCIHTYIHTYIRIYIHTCISIYICMYIGTPSSPEGGARGAGSGKKTAEPQGAKKIKVTTDLKIKHLEEASAITSSPAPKASRGRTKK
jgi:hypothetical protein